MSKLSTRRVKAEERFVRQTYEDILHFPLRNLLPTGQVLSLNKTLGTLARLSCEGDTPKLLMEQQFTTSEVCVLLPLLHSHPHYCPYETLVASFSTGSMDELSIARSRQRLREAAREGVWDQEMRPVRNVLSRTRLKLQNLGLDVISMFETGYILMPLSRLELKDA